MADANIWVPGADVATAKAVGLLYKGTSGTSNTITDTGSLNFTIETGLYFGVGEWLVIVDAGNINNWMSGQVVSYDSSTGTIVFSSAVSHGSGTISSWSIFISGVWVNSVWSGGTASNPVILNNTLVANALATINANLAINGVITSTAGDVNLNVTTTLADADATLTPAQLFGGTLLITPTNNRILTLPTAAQIIAYCVGYAVGSKFEFTVVNDSLSTVTLAPGSGILQNGKTLVQDGSATFKVTIDSPTVVSITNTSTAIITNRAGAIISSRSITSATDITLVSTDAGYQLITMTAEGQYVILPDATTLYVTSPTYTLQNDGYYPFGVKDAAGNVIGIVDMGGQMILSLADKSTAAGSWRYTGNKLLNAFIASSAVLGTSYGTARMLHMSVQVTADLSVHFCEIASGGFAAFVVDNANKTIGSPYTVTTTANSFPKGVFRVDDSRIVVFYGDATNTLYSSAILLLGTVLVVGLAASTGVVADIASDNAITMPKIAQLDTNLFLISYATADGAGVTAAIGCQLSDVTTMTFGSAANINTAADNQSGSTVTLALTTTTGLVFYKVAGPPKAIKAVVVSVTNAVPPVCTVGTPVTMQNSTVKNPPTAVLLSPTLAVVLDDDNTSGKATAKAAVISGTSIATGASLDLVTGLGVTTYLPSGDGITKYNSYLSKLTTLTFLFWIRDSSGISVVLAASVDGATGTITAGNKVTGSFSIALDGSAGAGVMLAPSATHFVGVMLSRDSGGDTARKHVAIANKISGTDITVGKALVLDALLPSLTYPYTQVMFNKNSQGIYAVAGFTTSTSILGGDVGIQLFQTDGLNIIDKGVINEYGSVARKGSAGSSLPVLPIINDNSIVALAATLGTKAPASAVQLRVNNIVLATR